MTIKFLPKFVTGEVYALNERVAGWLCEAIMDIVLERYGDSAAFAGAFIENSTILAQSYLIETTLDCKTSPSNWRQPQ